MSDLRNEFSTADRLPLLGAITSAIHGFTMARDPDASSEKKSKINNFIHYLAGHLIALNQSDVSLTESRLDGILEQLRWLDSGFIENVRLSLTR